MGRSRVRRTGQRSWNELFITGAVTRARAGGDRASNAVRSNLRPRGNSTTPGYYNSGVGARGTRAASLFSALFRPFSTLPRAQFGSLSLAFLGASQPFLAPFLLSPPFLTFSLFLLRHVVADCWLACVSFLTSFLFAGC